MASRTVWIVGGLVVAIGAIAYLSHNKAPAGKDAAGTIVEAKRARSDGTNSFNPAPTASTNDASAADAAKAAADADAAKAADAAAAAGSGDNTRNPRGEATKGRSINALRTSDAADAQAAAQGSLRGSATTQGMLGNGGTQKSQQATTQGMLGNQKE
jgi:hypothetical protein